MPTLLETEVEGPVYLAGLRISEFMSIRELEMAPNGRNVRVHGRNGSGKSTLLSTISWLLCGKEGAIEEVINNDADRAEVEGDFGTFIVKKVKTLKGSARLTITRKADGTPVPRQQEFLDRIRSNCLNPIRWLDLKDADQLDEFLRVQGVKPPVSEVEKITGELIPPRTDESASAYLERLTEDNSIFYMKRKDARKTFEQKQTTLVEQRTVLARFGETEAVVSTTQLVDELQRLNQVQVQRHQLDSNVIGARRVHNDQCQKLGSAIADAEKLESQIADLTRKLSEKRQQIADQKSLIESAKQEHDDALKALEECLDPTAEIAAVRQRINLANESSARSTERSIVAKQVDTLVKEVDAARRVYERHERELDFLRAIGPKLLQGRDLGIPGLEAGKRELRLNGAPFSQASTAERLLVAMVVATKQEPPPVLKLILVDRAESLDEDNKAMMLKFMRERGWQVILAEVVSDRELEWEISQE